MEEAVDGFEDDANSVISSNTISVSGDDKYGITSGIRLTGYEVKDNGVIPDYNFRVAGVKILENRIESNQPLSHLMTLKIAVSNQIFSLQSRTVLITRIKMVLLSTSVII